MKKVCVALLLQSIITIFFSVTVTAGVEPTDIILSDSENSIYMTSCNLSSITDIAQEPACSSIIYKVNLNNNNKVVFYRDSQLDRVQLSPDSNRLAVIRNYYSKTPELLIIDKKEKKEIAHLKAKIMKYIWSPDSRIILYITGERKKRSRLINSTGVWVYNIEKNEKKMIAEKAQDIFWPTGDDIFIINYEKKYDKNYNISTNYGSYIYNYKTGSINQKGLNGVQFSFDGKYSILYRPEFYDLPDDEGRIRIDFYDLKNKKKILAEQVSSMFQNPVFLSWDSFFFGKDNRVIFWEMPWNTNLRDIKIVDIDNNRVLKTVKGKYKIIGTNSDRSKIVIFSAGKFEAADVP